LDWLRGFAEEAFKFPQWIQWPTDSAGWPQKATLGETVNRCRVETEYFRRLDSAVGDANGFNCGWFWRIHVAPAS